MSVFDVEVKDNQSSALSRGNLKDVVNGVRTTTLLPGGGGDLTFKLYRNTLTIPNSLGYGYEVRANDPQGCFFVGRMTDVKPHVGPDGEFWNVLVQGYGVALDDQSYTSQDVSGLATDSIIQTAIGNAPKITAWTIDPGYTLSGAAAVNLKVMTMAQVVNFAATFGDGSNNWQIWYVYPDNDGTVRLIAKDRPTVADLTARRSDFEVLEHGFKGRVAANRIVAQYNSGASVVTVNDTTLQGAGPNGWGFIRTRNIVIPEVSQSADATQIANTVLAYAKLLRLSASRVQAKKTARFQDVNRLSVVPWRVRSGQLVQLEDVPSASGSQSNLTFNNSFLIVGTTYDEDSQTLDITPENWENSLQLIVARAKTLLGARHTITGAA